MAEAANTDDADTMGWVGAEAVEGVEDGSSAAHEGGGILAGNGGGDLEDEIGFPDGVEGHGALVGVVVTVEGALWAEGFVAGQALLAVCA